MLDVPTGYNKSLETHPHRGSPWWVRLQEVFGPEAGPDSHPKVFRTQWNVLLNKSGRHRQANAVGGERFRSKLMK